MRKSQDIERAVEFELFRATENAALNAIHWHGRGNKEAADQAACDAINGVFDLVEIIISIRRPSSSAASSATQSLDAELV